MQPNVIICYCYLAPQTASAYALCILLDNVVSEKLFVVFYGMDEYSVQLRLFPLYSTHYALAQVVFFLQRHCRNIAF